MLGEILRGSKYTSRSLGEYHSFLFPDGGRFSVLDKFFSNLSKEMHGDSFLHLVLKNEEVLKDTIPFEDLKRYTGGWHRFFANGAQILDMGSGGASAVNDIYQLYHKKRHIQIVGLDFDYTLVDGTRPRIDKGNFIGANWKNMPFMDGSFDAILGVESFPRYGRIENDERVVEEVTRIAKPSAIWRATFYPSIIGSERSNFLIKSMLNKGWEIFVGNRSFIAQLKDENKFLLLPPGGADTF